MIKSADCSSRCQVSSGSSGHSTYASINSSGGGVPPSLLLAITKRPPVPRPTAADRSFQCIKKRTSSSSSSTFSSFFSSAAAAAPPAAGAADAAAAPPEGTDASLAVPAAITWRVQAGGRGVWGQGAVGWVGRGAGQCGAQQHRLGARLMMGVEFSCQLAS